jgi:hypothetical protein
MLGYSHDIGDLGRRNNPGPRPRPNRQQRRKARQAGNPVRPGGPQAQQRQQAAAKIQSLSKRRDAAQAVASQARTSAQQGRAARRAANKAGRATERTQRQLSRQARAEVRRIARELKRRRRAFDRLFRGQAVRGLGNPALMAMSARAGSQAAAASRNPAAGTTPSPAEVGLFEQNLAQILNEDEVAAVGKFVSAWIGQGQDQAAPEAQAEFVRKQIGGDAVLGTAWVKLRSAYVASSQGQPVPPASSAREDTDDESDTRSAGIRTPQPSTGGNNTALLLVGVGTVALIYVATRPKQPTKKRKI